MKNVKFPFLLVAILGILLAGCDASDIQQATQYTVVGSSLMSGAQVDAVLCKAASPACGTGQTMADIAQQYNIKVSFGLSIFRKESTFGKAGVTRATKGLGDIRCAGWSYCIQGFRAYSTWAAGYTDFFRLISNLYIKQWGRETVNAIIEKYAPSSENDTILYVNQIEVWMDQYEGGTE